jgi:hypothetical protein
VSTVLPAVVAVALLAGVVAVMLTTAVIVPQGHAFVVERMRLAETSETWGLAVLGHEIAHLNRQWKESHA